MNTGQLAIAVETLHSGSELETFIERLLQDIKDKESELNFLKRSPRYTAPVKKKMLTLEQQINDSKQKIVQAETALSLEINSWVIRSDNNCPGKVIEQRLDGKIPCVHVLWSGSTVTVPEQPLKLKAIAPDDHKFIWMGEDHPKFIRRIDHVECADIDELTTELSKLTDEQKQLNTATAAGLEQHGEISKLLTYLRKRIIWVEKQDLDNLERTVRQGLDVFYRVGAALAEISDRGLYKQLGYSNFRQYLKERWDMNKSKAYRLIAAAEVMKNLTEEKSVPNWGHSEESNKSVPNWGHKVLPESEAVVRELSKAPKDLQSIAWSEAVKTAPNGKVTAVHTERVVSKLRSFDEAVKNQDLAQQHEKSKEGSNGGSIVADYKVGQLVRINSDRSDKRLVGLNASLAVITAINNATVDLKLHGKKLLAVSPNDMMPHTSETLPIFHLTATQSEAVKLILMFDSPEEIIEAAIATKSREL